MPHHSCLAERKGDEHPHDVELDKPAGRGVETQINNPATAARMMMPLLNTSRSPPAELGEVSVHRGSRRGSGTRC